MLIKNKFLVLIGLFLLVCTISYTNALTFIADDAAKAVTFLVKQIKQSRNLQQLDSSNRMLLQKIGTKVDDYIPYISQYSKEDRFKILLAAAEHKKVVKPTENLYFYRAMLNGSIQESHLIDILKIEKMQIKNLPDEANETLTRIKSGGPFPYDKDGTVFRNREKKLPMREDPEYYSEYTLKTPGVYNRGARRLVIGKNGEIYYTEDHYQTFKELTE